LQANTVTGEAELIGKTPRRGLRAGFPILASSVRRPILVAKGSLITMVLRAPKMLLTAQGKALDNGSDGDVIRINNTQSNKIVEAEVIGHGRVAVRTTSMIAMN
jgi:flagellar basal body P-ring formation protein FlgA